MNKSPFSKKVARKARKVRVNDIPLLMGNLDGEIVCRWDDVKEVINTMGIKSSTYGTILNSCNKGDIVARQWQFKFLREVRANDPSFNDYLVPKGSEMDWAGKNLTDFLQEV